LRLRKTALRAKEKGLSAFSTTLLVSPYQDHNLLKQLGFQIARETGINFYYEDFRGGFRQAQAEAKLRGIYRQKYCGCKYSVRPGDKEGERRFLKGAALANLVSKYKI
jgi:hypothetical protein